MSAARKPASKASVKKTTKKKTTSKKTAARSKTARSTTAKKTTRATAKKTTAKKPTARKTTTRATTKKTTAKATKKTTARAQPKSTRASTRARADTGPPPTPRATQRQTRQRLVIRKPLPKKPTARPPRPAKLDAGALRQIREQLEGERADLERHIEELEQSSFEGTQSELTGEVGLDEDFADAGTATFERERDLSIRNNILDLIDQITQAIERIDEGVYGTCARCGQPIDAARLKALPHASLCMDCKRREERAR